MILRMAITAMLATSVAACATSQPSIAPVAAVDLPRFMGDWYVIAHIPSWPERQAYDAVESYRLDADGRIRTTFSYRKGSFTAPVKTLEPVGTVVPDTNNAVWGMQVFWPIKAEFVIVDLDPAYQITMIGRSKRDYVWLMARQPQISSEALDTAIEKMQRLGYDTAKLRMVPQSVRKPSNTLPPLRIE